MRPCFCTDLHGPPTQMVQHVHISNRCTSHQGVQAKVLLPVNYTEKELNEAATARVFENGACHVPTVLHHHAHP